MSESEDATRIRIPGTLCIECIVGGEVAADAVYKILTLKLIEA